MKHLVVDVEANGLTPDRIWGVVFLNPNTDEVVHDFRYPTGRPTNVAEVQQILNNCDLLIGHNIIGYDLKVLRKFFKHKRSWKTVYDTLVVSRLCDYKAQNRKGKHSLEAWGSFFGEEKSTYDDFSQYSDELMDRCVIDCQITGRLFRYQQESSMSDKSKHKVVELEHHAAFVCDKMEQDGFKFNEEKARKLLDKCEEQLYTIRKEMDETIRLDKEVDKEVTIIPKKNLTKKLQEYMEGTTNKVNLGDPTLAQVLPVRTYKTLLEIASSSEPMNFYWGGTYRLYKYPVFNPGSPKQRMELLWKAGWKPTEKTKGHIDYIRRGKRNEEEDRKWEVYGWKTSEVNLATLPEDAPAGAHKLAQWVVLDSRRSTLQEWLDAVVDGRIHSRIQPVGSWTHRKSHSKPNCANIFSAFHGEPTNPIDEIKATYDSPARSCWEADEGTILVGTDADSIQLRVLAHYLNNKEVIHAVESGNKEDGTDIHSLNLKALGLPNLTRDNAKTFIYAFILNASIPKLAEILHTNIPSASQAVHNFYERTPGLRKLKTEVIPYRAEMGYFTGLDGRIVLCDSEHLMLAGFLQEGESTAMKLACRIWREECIKRGIWFKQVNDVHDEWQTCFKPEEAELGAKIQQQSLTKAGEILDLRVKLAGSSNLGKNWLETH